MNDRDNATNEALDRVTEAEAGWYGRWFGLMRLLWVAAAGALWYVMPEWGPWAVALAVVPWAVQAARTRKVWIRTPFDAVLLLFLITAGLSLAVAYDPQGARAVFPTPIGWGKLWGLILATLVFYAVASLTTEQERIWAMVLLSALGAAVAVYFVTTNDWAAAPVRWALIPRLGNLVQSVVPSVPGHRLSRNVAGGLVALILPVSLEVAGTAGRLRGRKGDKGTGGQRDASRDPGRARRKEGGRWRAGEAARAVWGWGTAALMSLGLFLSSSRGAWVAFASALGLAAGWWLVGRVSAGGRRIAAFLGLVTTTGLIGGLTLAAVPSLQALTLGSEGATNRLQIASQAALLVRDYGFTGIGLGQFPEVHSTYALMIHVPVLVFAHMTPLDVAVEQGLPAAIALIGIWAGAAWMGLRALARFEQASAGLRAGLLGLAAVIIHGAFDTVMYGSRALLLLWLPVGLIVAAERQTGGSEQRGTRSGLWRRRWGVVAGVTAALAIGIPFWRPLAATWQANLGAVHQTRVELRAYDRHHFGDPTLAEIRQAADLSVAIDHFERAVTLDPGQPTARTRLSQIALARGEYDKALAHAQAAWDAGHRDRITRLVLGDALVAHGRIDEATTIARGLERASMRLNGQAFYQYQRHGDDTRAAYAREAARGVD